MTSKAKELIIRQPDDWHLHLRDGNLLRSVVAASANVFRRAVVMPNLSPPITSINAAINYKKRILDSLPSNSVFDPLMTIYLTDDLSPKVLEEGNKSGIFFGAKLYPANSTTNSSHGVSDLNAIYPLLETLQVLGIPLLIHGEVTDKNVDIYDREAVFIDRNLHPLLSRFPGLKVVLEHITTDYAVQFVEKSQYNLAATITPHHLHINRNAMFEGGVRSDFYCLPIAKREKHRIALRKAATSGKSCFFLGTDSAPHTRDSKESSCGCAGIFNAPYALESYAEVFDQEDALDRFEAFASLNGPAFYGLPMNQKTITLVKKSQLIPEFVQVKGSHSPSQRISIFHAGQTLKWSILSSSLTQYHNSHT